MMKKIIFYSLIVFIVLILVFSFVIIFEDTPKKVITINYTFSVKDGVGIDLDTDKLNFGGGPIGATLQRKMNISSPFDAQVQIKSEGPGQVRSNINNFVILKDQSIKVRFSLIVPDDLPLGKYEGVLFISLYEK